jgi:hypothetical protein
MAEVRAPGVYYQPSEQRIPPLELRETGRPVFFGITRRGPLDRPVRVTSMDRFVELFGEPLLEGYLGASLRGFFDNGGETCFVQRVARLEGAPGEAVALAAGRTLLDRAGQPTLRLSAQDPGTWGNELRVTLRAGARNQTFLTRDADGGAEVLQVKSTHALTVGTLVRVHDADAEHWAAVTRVNGKVVQISPPLGRRFASAAPTYVEPHAFDLEVRWFEKVERFEQLSLFGASPTYVERVLNERSRLVRVQALRPDSPPSLCLPMELLDAALDGGADGLEDLGPEDFVGYDHGPGARRGIEGLIDEADIDLLVLPDLMAAYERSRRFHTLRDVEVVQDAAIAHCERSRCRFAVLDLPPGCDHEEALRWRRQYDSAHAALYYPWVVVLEGGGRRRTVPPSGHIAGIIARSDRDHGVHKAPANEVVEGIVDLDMLLQDAHLARLNDAGVNCLRPFAARGLRVWGARTASSDPEWRYVNVRRTVSTIAADIEEGTQWAVFEPNDRRLWKRLTRLVVAYLAQLRERGMLAGETPEQAFFVQCDAETNPPDSIDRGMLVARIGLAVTRPVEFIVFRLSQRLEDQAQDEEE